MDVLNLDLEWIEGRCYRKVQIRSEEKSNNDLERKPTVRLFNNDEESYDGNLPILHENNRFFISISVPQSAVGYIMGTKFATKKSIEADTGTSLNIPRSDQRDRLKERGVPQDDEVEITIVGGRGPDVARAHHRIEDLCHRHRWQRDYTHFISVPMNNKSIQENFNKFKNEVLAFSKMGDGIREAIFEIPAKLHLTFAMLTLLSKREKEKATALLQKCQDNILQWTGKNPLTVEIRGVEYMNDEPQEVQVLYGKVREKNSNNCVQLIANYLAEEFSKAGYARRDPDSPDIKLHVTLMKGRSTERDSGLRQPFDATQILEKYADYYFGSAQVTEIHISIRHTKSELKYWRSTYTLQL